MQQQSVPAPVFDLRRVHDAYTEGTLAVESRAQPNRVRQAWSDAAGGLPPPMPAAVGHEIGGLGDEPTATSVVAKAHEVAPPGPAGQRGVLLLPGMAQGSPCVMELTVCPTTGGQGAALRQSFAQSKLPALQSFKARRHRTARRAGLPPRGDRGPRPGGVPSEFL